MSKSVLVVEDDDDLRATVVGLLCAKGYDARAASNGAEALEMLERGLPDVILFDMRMPVMNGWEFARAFHQSHDHRAPIVVVTAASDAHALAREIGAEGCLSKPFDCERLLATVEGQIHRNVRCD